MTRITAGAMLGLCLAGLSLPAAAIDYYPGYQDPEGFTFLYLDRLDDVYSTAWQGTPGDTDAEGRLIVSLRGIGKSAEFTGEFFLSCDGTAESYWTATAESWGEPPMEAFIGAQTYLCNYDGQSFSANFPAEIVGVGPDDILTLRARRDPGSPEEGIFSGDIGSVWVNFCESYEGAYWCDVSAGEVRGWLRETSILSAAD